MTDDSKYCIYLELEPYLAQWLIHEAGGQLPVKFRKLSVENRMLSTFLIAMPHNAAPDLPTETSVPIAIPAYRGGDPTVYNYLPVSAKHSLKERIRDRFIIALWTDLHSFGNIGKRRDYLIYAWMQKHGIEEDETNFNTIAKIYQRQHRAYLQRGRRNGKNNRKR